MNPTDPVHDFKPMAEDPDFTESFDARDWAMAFIDTLQRHPMTATDEETMLGWFANALMRGYDTGRNDSSLRMAGRICGEQTQKQQGQRAMAPPTVSERRTLETIVSDPCGILAGHLLAKMVNDGTARGQLEAMATCCRAAAEICHGKFGRLSKAFYGQVQPPVTCDVCESPAVGIMGAAARCNMHLTPDMVATRMEFG